MLRETVYTILDRIAKIKDPEERKLSLRETCLRDNVIAIVVQRVYHPNYNFDLPEGPMPEIAKKSNHDAVGPFIQSLKKWDLFRIAEEYPLYSNMASHKREQHFIDLYESVASDDAELLVAVKDKKLPWDTLDANFVVDALPEMFPDRFRPENKVSNNTGEYPVVKAEPINLKQVEPEIAAKFNSSKKDQCLWIMENNPNLTRKEYLELFEKVGVKKTTGGIYYQELKNRVSVNA